MYRIRLYIVPEQDEDDEKEDFSSSFVDKDLLSSNNGCWWDTVKGDGRVTVTHRANKAKVKVAFSESQQDKDHEAGHCKEQRNNRVNKKNKVRQRLSSTALVIWMVCIQFKKKGKSKAIL
jgi:hypothetical protein